MSKGKSDAFTQATLLDLYDPDRSKEVLYRGQRSEFADFQEAFTKAVKASKDGTGVYFLSETVTSPSLSSLRADALAGAPPGRSSRCGGRGSGRSAQGRSSRYPRLECTDPNTVPPREEDTIIS